MKVNREDNILNAHCHNFTKKMTMELIAITHHHTQWRCGPCWKAQVVDKIITCSYVIWPKSRKVSEAKWPERVCKKI